MHVSRICAVHAFIRQICFNFWIILLVQWTFSVSWAPIFYAFCSSSFFLHVLQQQCSFYTRQVSYFPEFCFFSTLGLHWQQFCLWDIHFMWIDLVLFVHVGFFFSRFPNVVRKTTIDLAMLCLFKVISIPHFPLVVFFYVNCVTTSKFWLHAVHFDTRHSVSRWFLSVLSCFSQIYSFKFLLVYPIFPFIKIVDDIHLDICFFRFDNKNGGYATKPGFQPWSWQ